MVLGLVLKGDFAMKFLLLIWFATGAHNQYAPGPGASVFRLPVAEEDTCVRASQAIADLDNADVNAKCQSQ